mgnify:CR=1 FL=1
MMDKRRGGGMRRKKVCQFCADKSEKIDYKDVEKLRRYITEMQALFCKTVLRMKLLTLKISAISINAQVPVILLGKILPLSF